MEQEGFVAPGRAVDILDHQRSVGDEMRDLIGLQRAGGHGPGMGTGRPDRGEMALAAAGRSLQQKHRVRPIGPSLHQPVGRLVGRADQKILAAVARVEGQVEGELLRRSFVAHGTGLYTRSVANSVGGIAGSVPVLRDRRAAHSSGSVSSTGSSEV